jgi:zinc transport system permease protein
MAGVFGKEEKMIANIFKTIAEMLSFAFLVRALVVGTLVSICAALLGVSLVLKRYSMIGDGLSHVGFGALAAATALHAAPLLVAIPLVIAAAFLLLRLGEKHLLKGDAAIALVSTSSLALGVVVISQTTGMNTDVCNYLFGSILAMNKTDVVLSIVLSGAVLVLFVLFYHTLFAITFDETFAKTAGVKTGMYNMLIAFLTALVIVLGMRMMGAMLISALIIFPSLTAMRLFKKFKSVSICAVCVSICCFFAGVVVSYVYAIPTGASVVLINICAFVFFWLFNYFKKQKISFGGNFPKTVKTGKAVFTKNAYLLFLALMVLPLVSCTNKKETAAVEQGSPVIEIKEKMFLAQTNDVYLNPNDYLGKTIKVEGLFKREQLAGSEHCFVLRYGPGCCGSDGNAGFEVAWNRPVPPESLPPADEWVEAVGVLSTYRENGYPYLYLALTKLSVMDFRGAEFVTQ